MYINEPNKVTVVAIAIAIIPKIALFFLRKTDLSENLVRGGRNNLILSNTFSTITLFPGCKLRFGFIASIGDIEVIFLDEIIVVSTITKVKWIWGNTKFCI